jgi:IS1 family transposase
MKEEERPAGGLVKKIFGKQSTKSLRLLFFFFQRLQVGFIITQAG